MDSEAHRPQICRAFADAVTLAYGLPEGPQRDEMRDEIENACLAGEEGQLDWSRLDEWAKAQIREASIRQACAQLQLSEAETEEVVRRWHMLRRGEL